MRHTDTERSSTGVAPEADREVSAHRNGNADENSALLNDLERLFDGEKELVRELIKALREIRYGSIVLTVHEGRVVEINKSIRIRKTRAERQT